MTIEDDFYPATPPAVPTSSGPTGPKDDVDTTVKTLNSIKPQLSPFLQKVLEFIVGILTGIGGDLSVKGDYSKSQDGTILGTAYTFTETVNGSADIKAVPS
jgi:hypothetical protein